MLRTIVITIKDLPNGNVSIVSSPSFAEMARQINSGESASDAQGYALTMIRKAREVGKEKGPTKIWLPRQGR